MDRGAWWATVHGVAKSRTGLRDFTSLTCASGSAHLVLHQPLDVENTWRVQSSLWLQILRETLLSHTSSPDFFIRSILSDKNNVLVVENWGNVDARKDYIQLYKHIRYTCLSAQSCPTLCDPMDCSPPHCSVYRVSLVRMLEWVAISSSRGIFLTRRWGFEPMSPELAGRFVTTAPPGSRCSDSSSLQVEVGRPRPSAPKECPSGSDVGWPAVWSGQADDYVMLQTNWRGFSALKSFLCNPWVSLRLFDLIF